MTCGQTLSTYFVHTLKGRGGGPEDDRGVMFDINNEKKPHSGPPP